MVEATPIPDLGVFLPLLVLAEQGWEDTDGLSAIDALVPEDLSVFRAVYGPLLERADAVAATGLELMPDAALSVWVAVLRAQMLTGEADELGLLPSIFMLDGRARTGLTPLLRLPLWERLGVFQAALHLQAESGAVA